MGLEMVPFVMLNGNAREAISFYQKTLDAEVLFIQADENRVDHSVLKIGESKVMISDRIPQLPHQTGTQVNICITIPDKKRAEQIYAALIEEGVVHLPIGEMPFSPAYGIVTDKYGVCFQVFTQRNK
ncbi:VOC family protein [Shimazuella sp. AN120528]|uniref:VOC family protein n=1 Tax=Shimazuella soli TaxID=1892854 RepID=UPI001F0F9382|nr:VOC family protein [Shimazuella soli]MCH5585414.1 VOC family protein [Shimazuella soli]